MSDPNNHEFWPNKRGKCKQIIGSMMCHLPEDAPAHERWKRNHVEDISESEPDELADLRAQLAEMTMDRDHALEARRISTERLADRERELAEARAENLRYESEIAEVCHEDYSLKEVFQSMNRQIDSLINKNLGLEATLDEAKDRLAALERALRTVLASATPNQRDHPTMYAAWQEALAELPKEEPHA